MGFLPGVLESRGGGLGWGDIGSVVHPGVPGGGNEGCVFGFFVIDDPSAGFFGIFIFVVSVIEGVASD